MGELLTAEELAQKLKVQPTTVQEWARSGRIPSLRLSPKVVRFQLTAVIESLTRSAALEAIGAR